VSIAGETGVEAQQRIIPALIASCSVDGTGDLARLWAPTADAVSTC
jgi:hypothetical protein